MIFTGEFSNKQIEVFTFDVPIQNASSLKLVFDGPFEHMFIILKDPQKEIRGLFTFKTRVRTYFVGEDIMESTNGTKWGNIPDGIWELSVVTPQHATGKFFIDLAINEKFTHADNALIAVLEQNHQEILSNEKRWYRGELHAHSYFSDGRVVQEDIKAIAQQKNVDFMAITEHSFVTTSFLSGAYTIIPGTEITCDNDGHYNVYGLKNLIDYTQYFKKAKDKNKCMDEMFKDLSAKNYLLSINHPYAPGISLSHDFDISSFKALEVINCPYITHEYIDNPKAIRFFDYLWNKGHYLTGIGGSDSHTKNNNGEYGLGVPMNHLYMDGYSIDNTLDAITKGYVFLTRDVEVTVNISADGKDVLPGMEVEGIIRFDIRSDQDVEWLLFENGIVIDNHFGIEYVKEIKISENTFLRLEGDIDGEPFIFINPIYSKLEQVKEKEMSFKKLVDDFKMNDKI